jgi:hypothetical protein
MNPFPSVTRTAPAPRRRRVLVLLASSVLAVSAHAAPPRGLDIDQHSGVIGRIDVAGRMLQVNGQSLSWDPERLRVLHESTGQPLSLARLRSGMRVRYALEPMGARPAPLRIVTVYVQDLP